VSDNNLGDKTILEALEDPEPQKTVFGPTDQVRRAHCSWGMKGGASVLSGNSIGWWDC
jgi:hypothetical protein